MNQSPPEPTFVLWKIKIEGFVPCQRGCPVSTDAGRYVQLISEGRVREGYLVARNANPLVEVCGQVCAAPCEDHCRRGRIDSSVTIRGLKRFLNERFTEELYDIKRFTPEFERVRPSLWADLRADHLSQLPRLSRSGRRVAVVGAGPAGLSCAHDLLLLGHDVTLFEATGHFGGALKISIPMYRLGRKYIERLADNVSAMGAEIRLNAPLGPGRTLSDLLSEFDAVFLGVGAARARRLDVPGGDAKGVITSLEFLEKVNTGQTVDIGRKVIVIGGGRVALDAVRTSRRMITQQVYTGELDTVRATLRLGIKDTDVVICYRRALTQMPSYRTIQGREELEETLKEGIPILENLWPKEVRTENGRVRAMVFERKTSPDEPGEEVVMEADTVIAAVGQEPDLSFLRPEDGIEVTRWGTIAYDEQTMATTRDGVYTGGDAALGPATLIEAVAGGKRAAWSIDDRLRGRRKITRMQVLVREIPSEGYVERVDYGKVGRIPPPTCSVDQRAGFDLVEGVYSPEEAREQSDRCLNCHIQTVYQPSECTLCGRCVDHCPNDCLRFVHAAQLENGSVQGPAALIKDDERCIRCGLCARRCPTRAMQMERVCFEETVEPEAGHSGATARAPQNVGRES